MRAILSLSRSEIFSSSALMGAGVLFSGISPISRNAADALSRYCKGDLVAISAMSSSLSPGNWPDGVYAGLLGAPFKGNRGTD